MKMSICPWCQREFPAKPGPGAAKLYCTTQCREAVHSAARRYALRLLDEQFITYANLRSATQPHHLIDHKEVLRLKFEEGGDLEKEPKT